ncbi:MAG: DNA repair protein RadA [SAR202 cluster bacterium]|nr:DNA repair protein RadA [SAR202 cluster bacterium]|tara:strand:+ start:169 stop:1563 length:1395 start_codon:yes stop_codon:yes gene_type:complete
MATKERKVWVCRECGWTGPQELGQCPSCEAWASLEESVVAPANKDGKRYRSFLETTNPTEIGNIVSEQTGRLTLPYPELNRVFGGGVVLGSTILLGGEPGIGKSTLLLQIADSFVQEKMTVVYGAGEESPEQIKIRADRLRLAGAQLLVVPETDTRSLLAHLDQISPQIVIIDSIQTLHIEGIASSPGSVAQVRESASELTRWARANNAALFLAGHVTKDGTIAGPRVLEHIVDVVLYLEGETMSGFRLLRGEKNRFGSTQELALLKMGELGLEEVADPSQVMLSERNQGGVGSVVVPILEGSRSIMVEIQALVSPTSLAVPRRMATGVDLNRVLLISAVLGRRLNISLSDQDILVNIPGGLRVADPGADLGISIAVLSNIYEYAVTEDVFFIGEVGLSGEIRRVGRLGDRIREGERLGFKSAVVPRGTLSEMVMKPAINLVEVSTLWNVMEYLGLQKTRAKKQ